MLATGCTSATPTTPAPSSSTTTTGRDTAGPTRQHSAPPNHPADVWGAQATMKVMPTAAVFADTLPGHWKVTLRDYAGPTYLRRLHLHGQSKRFRTIPSRCRPIGLALTTEPMWHNSYELFEEFATQRGWGEVDVDVQKYRTLAAAVAELRRWRTGFAGCWHFRFTTGARGSTTVDVTGVRATPGSLAVTTVWPGYRSAVMVKNLVIRRARSSLVVSSCIGGRRSDGSTSQKTAGLPALITLGRRAAARISRWDRTRG